MDNYQRIKQEIKTATLIAVSKNRSIEQIRELQEKGVVDFGENRVQEFLSKATVLPDINWHFIGQLQTNKVKYLIGKVKLIQSLDSGKLADEIEKQSRKKGLITECLIQLKFDKQASRGGVRCDDLAALYDHCLTCECLKVRGFMVVAPLDCDEEKLKAVFTAAHEIYREYRDKNEDISYLSMGMSADYLTALACGANMLRIGEKLFTTN